MQENRSAVAAQDPASAAERLRTHRRHRPRERPIAPAGERAGRPGPQAAATRARACNLRATAPRGTRQHGASGPVPGNRIRKPGDERSNTQKPSANFRIFRHHLGPPPCCPGPARARKGWICRIFPAAPWPPGSGRIRPYPGILIGRPWNDARSAQSTYLKAA